MSQLLIVNRASDSTSSTNNSRGYDRSYDRSSAIYSDKSRKSDKSFQYTGNHRGSSTLETHTEAGYHGFLDMPTALESNEDFGSMFKNKSEPLAPVVVSQVSLRSHQCSSAIAKASQFHEPSLSNAESPARYSRYTKTPPPLHVRQNGDCNNPSPYSLQSRTSNDGLLSPESASPLREYPPPPPPHKSPLKKAQTFDVIRNYTSPNTSEDSKTASWTSSIIRRTESTESFTRSGADGDADAKMVRNSVLARRDANGLQVIGETPLRHSVIESRQDSLQPPSHLSNTSSSNTSSKSPSLSSSASSFGQACAGASNSTPKPTTPTIGQSMPPSNNTTPRATSARPVEDESDSDDEPLAQTLHRISSNPRLSMMPPPSNVSQLSIVLPENPKRESTFDNLRSGSGTSVESSISVDNSRLSGENLYVPLNGQNQRTTINRTSREVLEHMPQLPAASQCAPVLMLGSHVRAVSDGSKSSEDDDDDDVPLALLPVTNSPLRGRTPDPRFSQQLFMGQGRSGAGAGERGSVLPPFARRLPQDPYSSAASVMNASRESLMLKRPTNMFPSGHSPVPGMPPGGLVGVIAEEERSKSWRRAGGSQGLNPGMSMGMQGPTSIPGLGHGLMGGPPMMPGMVMQEQTQFNHQLVQLVQQQSLMLQQMQAMMQQQQVASSVVGYAEQDYGQQIPGPPGLRPMSIMSQGQRTQSMVNLGRPANTSRTMSMINTASHFAPSWGIVSEPLISSATSIRGMANGYAPSVAPSERSTIGQPNRYRPVTNPKFGADTQSNIGGYNRTSMAHPPQLAPLSLGRDEESMAKKKKSGFFSAIIHPRGRNSETQVEEEEDWGSFARKRRSAMPGAA